MDSSEESRGDLASWLTWEERDGGAAGPEVEGECDEAKHGPGDGRHEHQPRGAPAGHHPHRRRVRLRRRLRDDAAACDGTEPNRQIRTGTASAAPIDWIGSCRVGAMPTSASPRHSSSAAAAPVRGEGLGDVTPTP